MQRQIDANLAAERRDRVRRHFAYPWDIVAAHNPAYGRYVEAERDRLGADHPLFRTQYELKTIAGEAGFLAPALQAQLRGTHPRRFDPLADATYVGAVDLGGCRVSGVGYRGGNEVPLTPGPSPTCAGRGELWQGTSFPDTRHLTPDTRDSTVLLIARVDWEDEGLEPVLRVEGVYGWTGVDHRAQYATLLDLARNVWHLQRLAVDATGLGQPLADFLAGALGADVVAPVVFTAATKSSLAYGLLAAVARGRLKWYAHGDDDADAREFWHQVRACRYQVRPNQQMTFFVPESQGHDDFIAALALLGAVAKGAPPPPAAAIVAARDPFAEGHEG